MSKKKPTTERDWMVSQAPLAMVKALPDDTSARKLRLFFGACRRLRASHFMKSGGKQLLAAIAHAEDYADGVIGKLKKPHTTYLVCRNVSRGSVREGIKVLAERPALGAPLDALCGNLRCVFGNPFRPRQPRPFPADVVALAQTCYAAFPKVVSEFEDLADALDGLGEEAAAAHCREKGHVKGCHVLDLILGKS